MSLLAQIETAFLPADRPSTAEMFEGDAEGAEDVFCGRSWVDLHSAELDQHAFALRVFTPQAFAYYLPAFMCAALNDETLGLADAVIDSLKPPKNDPIRPSFARRWARLLPSQKRLVVAFLRHFASRDPIALEAAASALESTFD